VVIEVNYRGSPATDPHGGTPSRARPGLTELEDIAAVQDWAVTSGLSDPARMVIEGGSWAATSRCCAAHQPERWTAGVSIVPVADYVTAYIDEMNRCASSTETSSRLTGRTADRYRESSRSPMSTSTRARPGDGPARTTRAARSDRSTTISTAWPPATRRTPSIGTTRATASLVSPSDQADAIAVNFARQAVGL